MTIKQLEAFYWAATAISFQVAADKLHISLSALSKRIAELEAHFGRPLFDRSGHRAVLTDAGRRLLSLATRVLEMSHEMDELLADDSGLVGQCRFGMGELAALTWMPTFISQAAQHFPKLRLEPSVDLGTSLERRLIQGELDFAVVAGQSVHSEIASHLIADVGFVWAASPQLVKRGTILTSSLLQQHALISMPYGAGPTRMMERWLTENGLESGARLTCNNLSAVCSLIAAGLGIGLFPASWLKRLAAKDVIMALRVRTRLPSMQYSFQHRSSDPRPLLRHLLALVRQTANFDQTCPLW